MSFYKKVQHGATDVSVTFKVIDSTDGTPETGYAFNTAGVDFWYRRGATGAVTTITEATQTVTGAHTDGGLVHVQDGVGRLDLPDAAVASGVDYIEYGGTFTDMIVIGGVIELEGASASAVRTFTEATFITDTVTTTTSNSTTVVNMADFVDAQTAANAQAGELWLRQNSGGSGTSELEYFRIQSNTAPGLLATVEAWPAGGAMSAAVESGDKLWRVGYVDTNAVAISGDIVAASKLDSFAKVVIAGAAVTGTLSTTQATSDLTGYVDDELIGRTVVFTGGTADGQMARITDYSGASGLITFTTVTTAPANADTFVIL
jgi:hypothetical protein